MQRVAWKERFKKGFNMHINKNTVIQFQISIWLPGSSMVTKKKSKTWPHNLREIKTSEKNHDYGFFLEIRVLVISFKNYYSYTTTNLFLSFLPETWRKERIRVQEQREKTSKERKTTKHKNKIASLFFSSNQFHNIPIPRRITHSLRFHFLNLFHSFTLLSLPFPLPVFLSILLNTTHPPPTTSKPILLRITRRRSGRGQQCKFVAKFFPNSNSPKSL